MAKPAGVLRGFSYYNAEGVHHLSYVVVPPYGHRLYSFERKRWTTLD